MLFTAKCKNSSSQTIQNVWCKLIYSRNAKIGQSYSLMTILVIKKSISLSVSFSAMLEME